MAIRRREQRVDPSTQGRPERSAGSRWRTEKWERYRASSVRIWRASSIEPRIYADANIPIGIVAYMRERLRWDVLFVLEHEDLRRARDIEHYRLARQLGRTIVTLDRDYIDDRQFPPGGRCGRDRVLGARRAAAAIAAEKGGSNAVPRRRRRAAAPGRPQNSLAPEQSSSNPVEP